MNPIIKDIISSPWLLYDGNKAAYAALLLSLIKGESINDNDNSEQREKNRSYVISRSLAGPEQRKSLRSSDIPEGSIAVIPIRDEIMKYDQACGPRGSQSIMEDLQLAQSNQNIKSILLVVDSPGGQVSFTDILSDAIKNCSKPVIGYVEGMAASGAYWIISGCSKIIASSDLDEIGCIGSMMCFADLQPYYEKEGVVFHEIYSTLSPDKNKDFRDIRANVKGADEQYAKDTLDVICAKFQKTIMDNRSGVNPSTLTGMIYFAPDALKLGLIDEIGTMDYALDQADNFEIPDSGSIPDENSPENINLNNQPMKISAKLTAIWAILFGAALAESKEEKEITIENLDSLNTTISELQDSNKTLKDQVDRISLDLQKSEKDLLDVTEKYEKLKSEDGGIETTPQKLKDDIPGNEDKSGSYLHNQVADSITPAKKP
jgi:signal peptide peptidase SppA